MPWGRGFGSAFVKPGDSESVLGRGPVWRQFLCWSKGTHKGCPYGWCVISRRLVRRGHPQGAPLRRARSRLGYGLAISGVAAVGGELVPSAVQFQPVEDGDGAGVCGGGGAPIFFAGKRFALVDVRSLE